jgi:hypothetical protein
MEVPMGSKHQETWLTYAKSWSEVDIDKRLQMLQQSVSSDFVYTDPHIQIATDYDELSNYMSEFQRNTPGGGFHTKNFEEHHEQSLAKWNMVNGEGNILGPGASFARYGVDGRLIQMTGFF